MMNEKCFLWHTNGLNLNQSNRPANRPANQLNSHSHRLKWSTLWRSATHQRIPPTVARPFSTPPTTARPRSSDSPPCRASSNWRRTPSSLISICSSRTSIWAKSSRAPPSNRWTADIVSARTNAKYRSNRTPTTQIGRWVINSSSFTNSAIQSSFDSICRAFRLFVLWLIVELFLEESFKVLENFESKFRVCRNPLTHRFSPLPAEQTSWRLL